MKWSQAGNTFTKIANHHVKEGAKHDAATNYVEAANCFKKLIQRKQLAACKRLLRSTLTWAGSPLLQNTTRLWLNCLRQKQLILTKLSSIMRLLQTISRVRSLTAVLTSAW